VLGAPVALVSLVDEDRQVFRGCLGLPEPWASRRGTPLSHSFCQHAVASREPLIVEDAREHPVLRHNPAIRDMGVIAYAGIPLIDEDGHALGSLCVIDERPRHWTPDQVRLLEDLAHAVRTEIRLARAA
jgi:GAF domain-containing protein